MAYTVAHDGTVRGNGGIKGHVEMVVNRYL